MGVHLRRSEALVPEQLLYDTKIRAAIKEVCGEGVTQRMGMKRLWEAGGTCDVIKSCTGTTLSECSAAAVQEERRAWSSGECSERWSTIRQIRLERTTAWRSKERHTLLVALPCHLHLAAAKLQVGDANRHNFRNAQAGSIEEFNQRRVANRKRG